MTRESKDKNWESTLAKTLPLLPLRDTIVYPCMVIPLFVGREKSINALEQAMASTREVFFVAQKTSTLNNPKQEDLYQVGTICQIIQMIRLPDGTIKVLVEAVARAKINKVHETDWLLSAEVVELKNVVEDEVATKALARTVVAQFEEYVKLNKRIPPEIVVSVASMDEPGRLADSVVSHLNFKLPEKQIVLEETRVSKRLDKLLILIKEEIEILRVERRIRTRVKKQMERTQREYYLNEQMNAIQKELGDGDPKAAEFMELEMELKKKKLPKLVEKQMTTELKKLKTMSPMSAEATVIRNYLDWVLALPWKKKTKDCLDLAHAQGILDHDHYGLNKVKERIIEFLAVRSLAKKNGGSIICLAGPPGVGKTSLCKSIAKSMGREFVRVSLGGVRDEAEIRGHRRTYIGSMPGKIIKAMKKAGTNNPVILLDEIDKMSSDMRGDPASALLEVLDPEQNKTFNDHYLEFDYDLSDVLFIATANYLQNMPAPLLDRMEVIHLNSYTPDEKLAIAKNYLIEKQKERNGLESHQLVIEEDAVVEAIDFYSREAGVRNLERELATICRKAATKIVKAQYPSLNKVSSELGSRTNTVQLVKTEGQIEFIKVRKSDVKEYLGPRKFKKGMIDANDRIGVTNGLAWTSVGGELLVSEVTITPGKGGLTITGQLGDVMKESASAALTYVKSRSPLFGIEEDFYSKHDFHIHVPEGAVPKDGPSAGITIATTLVSAVLQIPVRRDVAMTGEITLGGRVLPIGGLKEKMIAAANGGIKTVLIPMDNEKDLEEIPENIKKLVHIIPVDHMDSVIVHALNLEKIEQVFKNKSFLTTPELQLKVVN